MMDSWLQGGGSAPGWPAAEVKASALCSWESSSISSSLLRTHFPTTSAGPLPQLPATYWPTSDGPWRFKRSMWTSSRTARALSRSSSYTEGLKRTSLLIRAWKTWSTGEGNGKALQYSCLENTMSSMKRKKDITLKDEPPPQIGSWPICYWEDGKYLQKEWRGWAKAEMTPSCGRIWWWRQSSML